MTEILRPFVYWAQTKDQITLKVDLIDAKDLNVNVDEKKLSLTAHGLGAGGPNNYGFYMDLYLSIIPEETDYKLNDRQIDFTLKKKCAGWWPRVISQPQKPPWLRIHYDKWNSDDLEDNDNETRDICNDYPRIYDKLHKEEFGYRKEDFKTVYLIIYNLCQLIGFMYIFAIMTIRYLRDGSASINETYTELGNPMKFIQLLQFLEVMHPMFGYTKGNTLVSLMQVGGRAFILFCMVDAEPRMQTKPVIFYLFLVWSTVEVVRYPYYIIQLLNIDMPFLTWLRYTIWMPLYPLGFVCEGVIILRNIPYFEETQKFSVLLPNSLNFSLYFPTFMRIYLLALCIPGIYTVMSHMNHIRSKKLAKCVTKKK